MNRILVIALFLFGLSFFSFSKTAFAREVYSDGTPVCTSISNCAQQCTLGEVIAPDFLASTLCGKPPPPNTCGSDWMFTFDAKCKGTPEEMSNGVITCNYNYAWKQVQCSAVDSCVSGPYLNAGHCDANAYNGSNPQTACTIGSSPYKTCCQSTGVLGGTCTQLDPSKNTGDHNGVCSGGANPVFCGWGNNPPCGMQACGTPPQPPKCVPFTTQGDCIGNGIRQTITEYNYEDGSGSCSKTTTDTIVDQECKTSAPSPSPSPTELKCNQAYGTCGCQPGTGCKDGDNTDYRCCYRTCDKAAQACVTKFYNGVLNNGQLNTCNDNSGCTGNYTGVCQVSGNQAAFKVMGPPCSNCSYAKYSDGSFAWQGEGISNLGSFTHPVDAGKKFTWYINGKASTPVTCNVKNGQCGQEGCVTDDDCDSDYQCEDVCQ